MEGTNTRTFEEIVNEVKAEQGLDNTPQVVSDDGMFNARTFGKEENTFRDIKKDVPVDAIYSRLSDGSYSAKYDTYQGAIGNENRLANEQGVFEQAINGLVKNAAKVGTYALDATVGSVMGVANALDRGQWSGLWDSDFSKSLDDLNTQLDNTLVNYYTDEEKSRGVLAAIPGFGATNFWFNDVAGGLAFVGGALLPEVAIGILTGGTSLGVSAAKFAARAAGKRAFKAAAKGAVKELGEGSFKQGVRSVASKIPFSTQYKQGANTIRDLNRKILGSKTGGDIVGTLGFLGRSSNFEAGMEARHNYHDAIDNYIATYEQLHGEKPGYEELAMFAEDAKGAANGVYASNLAILSVSNSIMFADKFNIANGFRKNLNRKFDNMIGLGVKPTKGGKLAVAESTKGQRILGNTYKALFKPATEGIYEEGFQGVAGKAMQNYLTAKYNPDTDKTADIMSATYDAFREQYNSKEGWKEMFIGMIIGSGAGLLQGQGVAGLGKDSRKYQAEQVKKGVERANKSLDNLTANMNRATAMSNLSNQVNNGKDASPIVDRESTLINKDYISTQETFRSQEEILEDYNAVVDNMELGDDQIKELGGAENIDLYKNQLKESFKRDMDNYNQASKLADALGIEDMPIPGKKKTEGNVLEMKDLVVTNLMLGYAAERGAVEIAETLDSILGEGGTHSALSTISSMDAKKQKVVEQIESKKERLNTLRDIADKYLRQSEQYATAEDNAKYLRASELYTKATQEAAALEDDLARLSSSLGTAQSVTSGGEFQLDGLENVLVDEGILAALEKVEKIDRYVGALRSEGRTKEANDIEYLVQEYKNQVDAGRETKMFYANLADGKSLQGSKSLPSLLLGPDYKIDEETQKLIEENDAEINKALGAVNIKGPEKAIEKYNELVGENTRLSDRQKYKIDSYIRMFLSQQNFQDRVRRETEESSGVESTRSTSFAKGDTITIAGNPKYSAEDLGNLDTLNKIIADMEQAIKDYRKSGSKLRNPLESRNQVEPDTELQQLEAQLAELRERANNLGDDSQVQDLAGNTYSVNESDITTYETEAGPIRYITNENGDMVMLSDPTDNSDQIEQLEKQIEELKNQPTPETEEVDTGIDRLSELETKDAKEGLTEEEAIELQELSNEVDDWVLASGALYQGFRLSDLIRQREVLENTPIEDVEKVDIVSDADLNASVEIPDRSDKGNYSLAQHYDAVTATRIKDGDGKGTPMFEIANTRLRRFEEEVGFTFEHKTNDQGNILITEDVVDRINEESPVTIETSKDVSGSNYTTVKVQRTGLKGETISEPLKSDYNEETTKPQDTDALYAMKSGEAVQVEIDPNDSWNKKVIAKYKKDGDKKKLQANLLIRVLDSKGNFVSVFKGKRKSDKVFVGNNKFEALRDNIIENEEYLEMITESTLPFRVDGHGIKVDRVLIGHPNTIGEYTELSVDDSAVEDLGFVESGKVWTKSQKGDVDTTFLTQAMKGSKKGTKIPFLVFNRGGKRIAYPIRFIEESNTAVTELTQIYNSTSPEIDKVVAMNRVLASRGIDIKEEGNAFITTREYTNLNDDFFSSKVAQLENRPYIQNLESWKNSSTTMESIIQQGVMHNLNLGNPISSPKLKMDFENINTKPTEFSQDKNKGGVKDSTKEGIESKEDEAKEELNKDCDE